MTTAADSEHGVRSPFLLQCLSFLAEDEGAGGIDDFFPLDSGMRERATTFYGPSLPHGIPAFDLEKSEWRFFGESQETANLRLEVSGDGHFQVAEGDGDDVFIDLQLEAPEEIGEVLSLVRSLTAFTAVDVENRSVVLADIITSVGVCVPRKDGPEWNSIKPADIDRAHPETTRLLDAFFREGDINWDHIVDVGFPGWIRWSREESKLCDAVPSRPIPSGALIISKSRGLCAYRRWLAWGELYKDNEPALVVELNRGACSLMYFTDYVTVAAEGQGLTQALLHHWREPWDFLRTKRIELPVSVVSQLRTNVELRSAKWRYKQQFDALLREREPMAQVVKLYRRRIQDIVLVHSEYLEEIQIVKQPLPFPIEYPYRRFRRAEEPVLRIKHAQHLLNVVLKSIYYFTLAEVGGMNAELAKKSRNRLGATPPDGRLLKEILAFRKSIDEAGISLPVFGPLLRVACGEQEATLQRLVDVRNRFHHAPFSEKDFVSTAEEAFPLITEALRRSLRGIEFILPESYRFAKEKRLIKARMVSGYDSDFLSKDIETALPFESFPTGELVAVTADGRRALRLSEFFSVEQVESRITDIGVLDRREKDTGKLVYTLTREQAATQ